MKRSWTSWLTTWFLIACSLALPRLMAQEAKPTAEMRPPRELTAREIAALEPVEHNVLRRPIELADDLTHWVDREYGYGATQMNTRPVHLGVEFVNERGTPVYAAKAGRVVFAGDDSELLLGPQHDYYGNVVVLAHDLYSLAGRRIFTLYGHLETIERKTGDYVGDQARLGRVGSSGVALGAHLHFEVRAGDPFDYRQTRNPELWLQHYLGHGAIVGSVRDQDGEPLYGKRLTLRSETVKRDVYTYGGDEVNSDPVWRENFTIGDLPAGEYEIVVLNDKGMLARRERAQVEAYRTTIVNIVLDN